MTISRTHPLQAKRSFQDFLPIARWLTFALALTIGILAPFWADHQLRPLASERLETEQEIELAILFGKWFAALANTLSLCILSLILAGVTALLTKKVDPKLSLTLRLIAQTILCTALAVMFIAGVVE